jgi:predicted outer membrane protein
MKILFASLALLFAVSHANAQDMTPAQRAASDKAQYMDGCVGGIMKSMPDTTKAEATKMCEESYAKSALSK